MKTLARFFSVVGRISRIDYLHDTYIVCGLLLSGVFAAYFATTYVQIGSRATWGIWIVVVALGLGSFGSLGVRRIHDLNRSGMWVFVAFIPYLNDLFDLSLWFLDGTPGQNHYGEEPVVQHPTSWVKRFPGYRVTPST